MKTTLKNLIVWNTTIKERLSFQCWKANIRGISIAYEGWFSKYHLRANADFQDPQNDDGIGKTLARRAKEHAALWLGQSWGDLEIGSEIVASGKRFNDSENFIALSGYALVNMTAKYKLNADWSLNARVNNMLDKDYTLTSTAASWAPLNPAYNTPGTNLFVSMTYSPNF